MSRTIKKFQKNHPEYREAVKKRSEKLNQIKDRESKAELKKYGFA